MVPAEVQWNRVEEHLFRERQTDHLLIVHVAHKDRVLSSFGHQDKILVRIDSLVFNVREPELSIKAFTFEHSFVVNLLHDENFAKPVLSWKVQLHLFVRFYDLNVLRGPHNEEF